MITGVCQELDESTIAARREMVAWLSQTFAAEFRIVMRDREAAWKYASSDRFITTDGEAVDEFISTLCDEVFASRLPSVAASDLDRAVVAMPLVGLVPTAQVAVAEVVEGDVGLLERMASLWMTAARGKQQNDSFRVENDYFAEQLADDLEELTFLRSMVEHLDVSDTSNDLIALAEATLPLLNESIKAESLTLLMAPEGVDAIDAIPNISVGRRPLPDTLLMKIVQWFGESALGQPVVKNRLNSTPEGTKLRGVREFILVPLASRHRQMGWLLAANRRGNEAAAECPWPLSHLEFGSSEASLLSTTASILATHASNLEFFREKQQMLVNVVRSLVSALDAKDEYTCGHSERVALFGKILAEQAGYDEEQCERLYLTGLLHDVGKIGVSDAVLKKAGKLTDEEFAEIKRHPDEGWAILQDLKQLQYVLPGVLFHHERVDGGGYPDGLAGNDIPRDGRLLAIVDSYDAMTSDRPYRTGMPAERAQEILRSGAGTQWDAELVDQFFAVLDKIELVRNTYQVRERPSRHRGTSI